MHHLISPALLGGLVATTLGALLPLVPLAAASELEQTVDPDEEVGAEQVVLTTGHVDIGPKIIDGEWQIQVRDDTSAPPVWRSLTDAVMHVTDDSLIEIPADPELEFLGVGPGELVHVIPQTQNQDVIWVGWNTQDPAVTQQVDRGATLTLHSVEGPGELHVFLQSGNFSPPQILWDSTVAGPQPAWVEVNTHTHANWVFTEPGTYLVEMEVSADLLDGTTATDTELLRFAVGSETDPADAFAAAATEAPAATPDEPTSGAPDASSEPAAGSTDATSEDLGTATETADATDGDAADGDDGPSGIWLAVVGGGAALLLGAVAVAAVRSRRARARAEELP